MLLAGFSLGLILTGTFLYESHFDAWGQEVHDTYNDAFFDLNFAKICLYGAHWTFSYGYLRAALTLAKVSQDSLYTKLVKGINIIMYLLIIATYLFGFGMRLYIYKPSHYSKEASWKDEGGILSFMYSYANFADVWSPIVWLSLDSATLLFALCMMMNILKKYKEVKFSLGFGALHFMLILVSVADVIFYSVKVTENHVDGSIHEARILRVTLDVVTASFITLILYCAQNKQMHFGDRTSRPLSTDPSTHDDDYIPGAPSDYLFGGPDEFFAIVPFLLIEKKPVEKKPVTLTADAKRYFLADYRRINSSEV